MSSTLIGNRYRILRSLATGGFGETFLAEDTHTPSARQCVIKQLKPIINDPQMYQLVQERFKREAAILETLGEGNNQIPRLYAYFEEAGKFFLVQEFIEGQTLTQKVAAEGRVNENAVREILVKILPVLDYVHRNRMVHRDIKPDNIIMRQRDGLPVLIDFGAVKESMATALNTQGNPTQSVVVGTPGFMPSEQAAGRPTYSSDLYSLGLTGIYLLTGKTPQQMQSDPQTGEIIWRPYAPNISPGLATVLDKAIHSHSSQRYSTAQEMQAALQAAPESTFSSSETVAVSPGGVVRPPAPRPAASSNAWLKALIIGGLLGTFVAVAIALIRNALQSPAPNDPVAQQSRPAPVTRSPAPVATRSPAPVTRSPAPVPTRSVPSPAQSLPPASQTPTPADSPSAPPAAEQPDPEPSEFPTAAPSASPTPVEQIPAPAPSRPPAATPPRAENPTNIAAGDVRVPGLSPGMPERAVTQTFGTPTRVATGYWPNTESMLYELEPNQIGLGFIVDQDSRRLRQTEVSFAQSIPPEQMLATLNGMAGGRASEDVQQALQRVQQRQLSQYSFASGGLEGVIQRNESDRIYIAVWEEDLH